MRRLTAAAASIITMAACGGSPPAGTAQSPSPSPTATVVVASTPDPASTPRSAPTPASAPRLAGTLSCRLPVTTLDASRSESGGGFLELRTGIVTADPTSAFHRRAPGSNFIATDQSPVLVGPAHLAYSAGRWIPSFPSDISPDGKRYVWAEPVSEPVGVATNLRLRVVDIASGVSTVLVDDARYVPLAWTPIGIIANQPRWESTPIGLYLIDPRSGAVTTLRANGAWTVYFDGGVFGDPLDRSLGDPPARSLQRIDMRTGAATTWTAVEPPGGVYPIGALHDALVVGIQADRSGPFATWTFNASGQSTRQAFMPAGSETVIDGDRSWLEFHKSDGSTDIYLYADGKLQLVRANPDQQSIGRAAGPCASKPA